MTDAFDKSTNPSPTNITWEEYINSHLPCKIFIVSCKYYFFIDEPITTQFIGGREFLVYSEPGPSYIEYNAVRTSCDLINEIIRLEKDYEYGMDYSKFKLKINSKPVNTI